jgi:hypothetical protein
MIGAEIDAKIVVFNIKFCVSGQKTWFTEQK